MIISQKQIEAVLKLHGPERYTYSIKRIADSEEAWGLYKDGWALAEDNKRNKVFPLWPAKEYAQLCTRDEWKDYEPEIITVYDLLNELLPKLKHDNIKPSIFYTPSDKGVIVSADCLGLDLEKEMEEYS